MIGPPDVVSWAESLYDDFLRSVIDGRDFFKPPPRRDRLGRVPAASDPVSFMAAVQPLWEGSKQVRGLGYTVILAEKQRRARGLQNEPVAVEVETEADYLALLNRTHEVNAFRTDATLVLAAAPAARELLRARPRLLVANHGGWPGILEVTEYLRTHPRPGCFVRALPVSVHTKFIEAHEAAIEAMLSVHPESGYDSQGESFAERCGFRSDGPSIRGRFLCPRLQAACGFAVSDVELRLDTWSSLVIPTDTRVIACENKANFLALPAMNRTLALWGAGGAATGHFPRLKWLAHHTFVYWGDMDPCGFAILASLRGPFPEANSVLMDSATLTSHHSALGTAKAAPHGIRMERLTPSEAEAAIVLNEPPRGIEQEKLLFREGFVAVVAAQGCSEVNRTNSEC